MAKLSAHNTADAGSNPAAPTTFDSFRCPICDSRFDDEKSLHMHLLNTKKHRSVIDEIWHLRFLLAEAERDIGIYRTQRDEWRNAAKEKWQSP